MNKYNNLRKTFTIIAITKIVMVLITFLITSILFRMLGKENYGVYMAIFSLFSWMFLFDLGLGKGMRNYLTTFLAAKKYKSAQIFVSTTYISIILITLALFILSILFIQFIPLKDFLNIRSFTNSEISLFFLILTISFLFKFSLGLIDQILFATHQSEKVSLNGFYMNLIFLLFLSLLYLFSSNNMNFIAFSFGLSVLIVYIYSNFKFFSKYLYLVPKMQTFSINALKKVFSGGGFILFIQIGFMLIIGLDRILLQKYTNSVQVADYDIMYKVMSIILLPAGIVLHPLWASFNEAFYKKDFQWIKGVFKKLYLLIALLFMLMLVLALFFENLTLIWIGESIEMSYYYLLMMGMLLLCLIWSNMHTDFFVAINQYKTVLIIIALAIIIKYSIVYYFIYFSSIDLKIILASSLLSYILYSIFAYFYLRYIIMNRLK